MTSGFVDRVTLRPIYSTSLRSRLDELRPGQELEISLEELCVALGVPSIPTETDVAAIGDLAAGAGCAFSFDEFGHYNPTFRKLLQPQ